jgi:DNA polymerase-3 subunit delta
MFYVFHGDDPFSVHEALTSLMARMGDPSIAELNTTHLDGQAIDVGELIQHCSTIPFLADRRLIIVRGLLERIRGAGRNAPEAKLLDQLTSYLPHLPSTTRLIFVENIHLPKGHPILRLADQTHQAHVQEFALPQGDQLLRWTQQRVRQVGGEIEPTALEALCSFVGSDLYRLDQEVQKLAAYTDGQRPITEADVLLLTPDAREASIFDLVDALGHRDGHTACQLYHQLLDAGEHPLGLLGMITRQFRLMVQIKELRPTLHTADAIARVLHQNPYPVRKILAQSQNYSTEQLRLVYHKLLDTDIEIKTGQIDAELAIDTLIAGLSRVA